MSGQAGGVVHATKGVMTTLTTTTTALKMRIEVPPILSQDVPLGGGTAQPFDGTYSCSKTTLEYQAPGFGGSSTWTRQ
jgi:hypothetical protein